MQSAYMQVGEWRASPILQVCRPYVTLQGVTFEGAPSSLGFGSRTERSPISRSIYVLFQKNESTSRSSVFSYDWRTFSPVDGEKTNNTGRLM